MKIALVCRVYPSQRSGGMAFVCQDRARALVKAGHEVHVLTTSRDGHKGSQLDDEGVEVHHMPCVSTENSDEFAKHLTHHVSNFSPSILHLDSFDSDRPWWRGITNCPNIRLGLTMHGFCWGAYLTKLNEHMRDKRTDAKTIFNTPQAMKERTFMLDFHSVIGISLHEQWMMKQLMGLFYAKLVYNPIANYFFDAPYRKPPEAKRFLCAAISGHGERGFRYAEQAAQKVGVELVIAKNVSRDNMPELIDSCHGLVLPTAYAQGLDLCVGESIIRKRPVIVTATGSYLRESRPEGLYKGTLKLVPLVDPIDHIVAAMQDDRLHPDWKHVEYWKHGPENHAKYWLEAILG